MKLKSLLFICGLSFLSTVFAESHHVHPNVDAASIAKNVAKNAMSPNYCEIEVSNRSFDDVTVYGTFDDGSRLTPFDVYSMESPHYISLYYYGYCHRDMYLDIVTFPGDHVYSGFTRTETTVRIVPYLTNQVKAEVRTH